MRHRLEDLESDLVHYKSMEENYNRIRANVRLTENLVPLPINYVKYTFVSEN